MSRNEFIKNRCYVIENAGIPYAYISVKKDFYAEGFLIENRAILSGYFLFYNIFKAHILDNSMQSFEHYLEAICVSPTTQKEYFDINGQILYDNYILYDATMDEYCDIIDSKERDRNIQIKLIEDEGVIKDINYLIRSGIRDLNNVYKFYYDSLKKHRYGNLKELISYGIDSTSVDEDGTKISKETIDDLINYLRTLQSSNEKSKEKPITKQKKNKKKRK